MSKICTNYRYLLIFSIVGFVLVAGCVGGSAFSSGPQDNGANEVKKVSMPSKPSSLNHSSVLQYTKQYAEARLYNRVLDRNRNSIDSSDQIKVGCYGGLDERAGPTYYVLLECSGSADIHSDMSEGAGGGMTYAYTVTNDSTLGVRIDQPLQPAGGDSPRNTSDTSRNNSQPVESPLTVAVANFDEDNHTIEIEIERLGDKGIGQEVTRNYSSKAHSGGQTKELIEYPGKYKISVTIDNGQKTTKEFIVRKKDSYTFDSLRIYVDQGGELKIGLSGLDAHIDN